MEASTPAKKTAKSKPAGTKKAAAAASTTATHPPAIGMIVEAIKTLNKRGGSSFYAIKKFIEEAHELDMTKYKPILKRALNRGVDKGTLIRTHGGTGASGSFKLGKKGGGPPPPAAAAAAAVTRKRAPAAKKPTKAEAAPTTGKPASVEKKVTRKTSTKPKLKTKAPKKPNKKTSTKPKLKTTKAPKKAAKALL